MKIFRSVKARKRRAFSLIAVLIIALAGMALVGGILYTFEAFSGASRQTTSSSWEYNILQEAVEHGKAFVREQTLALIPDDDLPLTWKESDTDKISSLSSLLIRGKDGTQIGHLIKNYPINEKGLNGTLNLYIYSMGYTSDDIDDSALSASDRALLPPSIIMPEGGGGDGDSEPEGLR
ncbi:MAG: hypothetical protein LBS45_10910 [Synergistaceae bacterium]|jgi:hypothetical protein|nr:hypothetical protein [Synergistaceae bacterium]